MKTQSSPPPSVMMDSQVKHLTQVETWFKTEQQPMKTQNVSFVKFRSGADPPLEVVSGARYWWTGPVWTDNLAARIEGVLIGQHGSCTQLHTDKRPTKQRYRTKQQ